MNKHCFYLFYLLLLTALMSCHANKDAVLPDSTGSTTDEQPGVPSPIGKPIGAPVRQSIGPAGGSITSTDGKLTVTIPANALTKPTTISVQAVENGAPNGIGTAYTFGPDDIHLARPVVEVTYDYPASEQPVAGNVGFVRQTSGGVWKLTQRVQVDPAKRRLKARIRHVTPAAIAFIEQFNLVPPADTLVYLQELRLWIAQTPTDFSKVPGISDPQADGDGLFVPLPTAAPITLVRSYALNGNRYGTLNDGTFERLDNRADNPDAKALFKYTAPSGMPRGNPVALSVELQHGGKETLMLVSNVWIKNPVSLVVEGDSIRPVKAIGSLSPYFSLVIQKDSPNSYLEEALTVLLPVAQPGVNRFEGGNAVVTMFHTKGGQTKGYASKYIDGKGQDAYTGGAVTLLELDKSKGIVRGHIRGTLVYQQGQKLEPIHVSAEFVCKTAP